MDPVPQNPRPPMLVKSTAPEPVPALAATPVLPLPPAPTGPTASANAPVPSPLSGARRPRKLPGVGPKQAVAAELSGPESPWSQPSPAVLTGPNRHRPARPQAVPSPPGLRGPMLTASSTPGRATGVSLSPPAPLQLHPVPPPTRGVSSRGAADTSPQDKSTSQSEEFRVHIVTWNVGSAVPPDDITALFGPNIGDGTIDMYVIGLQEVNSMINKRLKDALFTDQWSELCMDTLSRFQYVLVTSERMQGVLLLVFCRYSHLPFLRGVQTESTRTGLGGYWGNKGGVSARMMVYGHPVCFLNCHLPAHMQNVEQRMEDFESILQQQQFEGPAATGVLDHDVVFWFGDLNFRIEGYDTHVVKSAVENNMLKLLWERDQLNMAKQCTPLLEGFMEGPLNFPPTYKFDVGTHTYDTSAKKRKPAWTDRVLWRLRASVSPGPTHNAALQRGLTSWLSNGTKVTQQAYRSHMGFTISDHKPVSAVFSLQFSYKVDVPLVTLVVEEEWNSVSDATVRFKLASNFSRSSSDWIGLYKVGFRHHKDYAAYVWARQEEFEHLAQEHQVCFPEDDLPKGCGEYIVGYYSNNMNSIVGVTEPFQVDLPLCSPRVRRRSRSASSSEDDSTLVLLPPQSRSPSPATPSQRSRSRSPALPSLKGLNLRPRPHSRDPAGRSPSPRASPAPALPRSPGTPGIEVSAPEALIAAIMGPGPAALCGGRPPGEARDAAL
ncbi:phosphatidylinositol 4,5-bisphosphate 5-phosphatase A [Megalops cyprinoides]|uniref:phosphatidylinositol 4,5-bisphosphate 5-phosphatase A n=1 Tax=Megalops cyprinoides TaxID=118141 RepID=UPI00186501B2|nr:phosphatidylinositol 4,5-bisphosphate 5-phosphatase A [Megalops cyprinoides]